MQSLEIRANCTAIFSVSLNFDVDKCNLSFFFIIKSFKNHTSTAASNTNEFHHTHTYIHSVYYTQTPRIIQMFESRADAIFFLSFFLHFIVFDCCFCFDFGAKNSHAWLECCYVRMFVWNVRDFVKNKKQMICEQWKLNVICVCFTLIFQNNKTFSKRTKLSSRSSNTRQIEPTWNSWGFKIYCLHKVCAFVCCCCFIVFNRVESNCCEYARCTVRSLFCWQIVQTK